MRITDVMISALAGQLKAIIIHLDRHFDELSKITGVKVISYVSEIKKNS